MAMMVISSCAPGAPAAPAPDVPAAPVDAAAAQITTTATPESTETLAALVNGQPITLAAFQRRLWEEEQRLAEAGVVPADRAAFEQSVLNSLIDQVLIEQAAIVQGLQVTPEELEAEVAVSIEVAGGEAAWQSWLAENGLTPETFRQSLYEALLTAKIRDQVIASVPDQVEQAHARHILVSTEGEARQIYEQLQNGADFAALALQHSRDVSTRDLGGDLGWFTREQLTEPVVAEVAFTQPIGQISEPVASRLGYHIIQTLERVADRPLDEAARAALFEVTFERWRQSLWDRATVERFVGG
ncbi:MAG: hypothetical protein HPY64_17345 [Anaerolineae bacterium]|nr:hypothetical protein [Anaerolineae bacterium]